MAEDEPWLDALDGTVDAGADAAQSTGRFLVDLHAAGQVAGEALEGQVNVDYALSANGATAEIDFTDVTAEGVVPVDGGLTFSQELGVGGYLDASIEDNVGGTATDAPELVNMRARWNANGAGRTDARLSGGDFTPDEHTETECWGSARTVVFYDNTFNGQTDGLVDDCAFGNAEFSER